MWQPCRSASCAVGCGQERCRCFSTAALRSLYILMPVNKRLRRKPGFNGDSGGGVAVDAYGAMAYDPSENVKALSEALSQRQDDLRDLNNKYLDARLDAMEKSAVKDAAHAREIRELESSRIDATRETDMIARNTAAAQALTAIQTLAATTSAEREALRSLVSTTATTIAAQTDRIVGQMTDRIAVLEKTSYTGAGKDVGVGASWGLLLSVIGVIATLLMIGGVGVTLVLFLNRTQPQAPAYVPAPQGTQLPATPPVSVPR